MKKALQEIVPFWTAVKIRLASTRRVRTVSEASVLNSTDYNEESHVVWRHTLTKKVSKCYLYNSYVRILKMP